MESRSEVCDRDVFSELFANCNLLIESLEVNWTAQKNSEKRRNWCPGIEAWGI